MGFVPFTRAIYFSKRPRLYPIGFGVSTVSRGADQPLGVRAGAAAACGALERTTGRERDPFLSLSKGHVWI